MCHPERREPAYGRQVICNNKTTNNYQRKSIQPALSAFQQGLLRTVNLPSNCENLLIYNGNNEILTVLGFTPLAVAISPQERNRLKVRPEILKQS